MNINEKLARLTPEQGKALAASLNSAYNPSKKTKKKTTAPKKTTAKKPAAKKGK